MPVTQDQITTIKDDFNKLIDDILAAVPHDHRVDTVIMFTKMAEGMILPILVQLLHVP